VTFGQQFTLFVASTRVPKVVVILRKFHLTSFRGKHNGEQQLPTNMGLAKQVVWLFVLALPVASIAWTVTHEEVFREPREYCANRSEKSNSIFCQKFFYLFTCEYCFSHWVAAAFLVITRYKLLCDDWRGYLIALFALVYMSNFYIGLFGHVKLEVKKDRAEIKAIEAEVEAKKAA
jgi:hypothetical protein